MTAKELEKILELEKGRKLKDIDVKEISVVGTPANRRGFLFFKQESDPGENAMTPEELAEFQKEYENFMDEELNELQIEKANKLSAAAKQAIKSAFAMLNKYKEGLPPDLAAALKTLAKYATSGYPYPAPYKKEEDDMPEEMEKAGRKISKTTAAEIARAIENLEKGVAGLRGLIVVDDVKKDAVTEEMLEVMKSIQDNLKMLSDTREDEKEKPAEKETEDPGKEEEAEEKDEEDEEEKPGVELTKTKAIENILERLEKVEKTTGVRKEHDEDLEKGDEEEEDPWPSLSK